MKPLTWIDQVPIYPRPIKNFKYNGKLRSFSRQNRGKGILSEVLFWKQVRSNHFFGLDFHRQTIIGNYIVDFYVPELGLVIEIDGSSHNQKMEYDNRREAYFADLGMSIFKITDVNVKRDLGRTLDELKDFIVDNFGTGIGL